MKDRTTISHTFYSNRKGELLISDGVKTLKKVSGLKILGIAISFIMGLSALVYLFINGCIDLIKHKSNFINNPLCWVFTAILTLVIASIFITNQSFMQMGDKTIGNILLFLGTLLLPIFSLVSLMLHTKKNKQYLRHFNFWAMVLLMQFCLLLITNNLMPLMMWK